MEFTNELFAIILFFVFVSGAFLFYTGLTSTDPLLGCGGSACYPQLNSGSTNSNLVFLSNQMNGTFNEVNKYSNQSIQQAANYQRQDQSLAAAFGYVFGGLAASAILVFQIPAMMMASITAFFNVSYGIIPTFFIGAIALALNVVALLGLMYYIMKVR